MNPTIRVELKKVVQVQQYEPETICISIERELEGKETRSQAYQEEYDYIMEFIDEKFDERID